MEFFTVLPLTQLSGVMPKTCTLIRAHPFKPWWQRNSKPARFRCQKMYVPANNMHNFFTYIAVRIVGAQLELQHEAHKDLMEFLDKNSLNDGDKFLSMRILEVRSAYCKNDFEWDNLQRLASQLMRDYVLETSHDPRSD
ncbi:hypothetical protein DCAR_0205616 [Daucus carota subsp. sativus]|uniref:Uncharacterized protein n=1 Tax=Daucus carota subsp. sativus TaxID=79200 RepID=A0AAF0WBF9_DAUCS|nr:hypothetical protein DCAR_0205616 [Daucus carota subsp. sativus]